MRSTIRTRRLQRAALALAIVLVPGTASAQPGGTPLVPEAATLSEGARRAIEATWLTDEERSDLRIFHGVWDERDLRGPHQRAGVAVDAWRLDDPALADPACPELLRGEATFLRGELRQAIELLEPLEDLRAVRLVAEAYETLGDHDAASRAAGRAVSRLQAEQVAGAADLTEGVRALMVRARLQGQPGRDFQSMLDLLARAHQELDRLYWPAKLAEAELLLEKDHEQEAIVAIYETLRLNPRCSEAW
ncbi:MAG: hypothetical protein ACYTJ0_13750, partial [Planctomycetota bacterium]